MIKNRKKKRKRSKRKLLVSIQGERLNPDTGLLEPVKYEIKVPR